MQVEASLWQVGLSTKLEEISDLRIFLNAFAGHCKRCGGPHVARGPLIAHPDLDKCLNLSITSKQIHVD